MLNLGRDALPGYMGYLPRTDPAYDLHRRGTLAHETTYASAFHNKPDTGLVDADAWRHTRQLYAHSLSPWSRTSFDLS